VHVHLVHLPLLGLPPVKDSLHVLSVPQSQLERLRDAGHSVLDRHSGHEEQVLDPDHEHEELNGLPAERLLLSKVALLVSKVLEAHEEILVGLAGEVDLGAVGHNADLGQALDADEPRADAVGELWLETSVVLQVFDLRLDLDLVRNHGEEGSQREYLSEEDDVAELDHQLHVVL